MHGEGKVDVLRDALDNINSFVLLQNRKRWMYFLHVLSSCTRLLLSVAMRSVQNFRCALEDEICLAIFIFQKMKKDLDVEFP